MMTPFLSKQFISVHVRVMLVDIIIVAVGTSGLPVGAIIKKIIDQIISQSCKPVKFWSPVSFVVSVAVPVLVKLFILFLPVTLTEY